MLFATLANGLVMGALVLFMLLGAGPGEEGDVWDLFARSREKTLAAPGFSVGSISDVSANAFLLTSLEQDAQTDQEGSLYVRNIARHGSTRQMTQIVVTKQKLCARTDLEPWRELDIRAAAGLSPQFLQAASWVTEASDLSRLPDTQEDGVQAHHLQARLTASDLTTIDAAVGAAVPSETSPRIDNMVIDFYISHADLFIRRITLEYDMQIAGILAHTNATVRLRDFGLRRIDVPGLPLFCMGASS